MGLVWAKARATMGLVWAKARATMGLVWAKATPVDSWDLYIYRLRGAGPGLPVQALLLFQENGYGKKEVATHEQPRSRLTWIQAGTQS